MLCTIVICRSDFENRFISSRVNHENPFFGEQTGNGISEPKVSRSDCCFNEHMLLEI